MRKFYQTLNQVTLYQLKIILNLLIVWNIKLKPDPEPPRNYPVPNFGMDGDIKTSLKNLNDQENIHGPMSKDAYV